MANFSEKMTDFRQVSVFSGNHLKCPAAQTKFSGSPGEMFILVRREASADPIRMDLTFGNSKFVAFPCLILRRGCTRTFFGVYFSVEQFSTFSEGSFSKVESSSIFRVRGELMIADARGGGGGYT